jgi:hypothetical protein
MGRISGSWLGSTNGWAMDHATEEHHIKADSSTTMCDLPPLCSQIAVFVYARRPANMVQVLST